jgi:hypothetical protein
MSLTSAEREEKTAQDAPGAIVSRGVATLVSPLSSTPLRPEQSLAVAVIRSALRAKDRRFFASSALDFWCSVAQIDPAAVRRRITF